MIKKKFNKKVFLSSIALRERILNISQKVSAIHIGGSFSSAEIIATIFKNIKRKDKFILSKGHVGILLYCMLEQKKILKKKLLDGYCKKDGILGVHPELYLPGVTASTGSLGHGLSIAAGMGLSKKYQNIFVLLSDGELMEGSVWEAALMISSFKINNIVAFVDYNDLQSGTRSSKTHPTLFPITKKFNSFGWDSYLCNGHDPFQIQKMINKKRNKPICIVAKTFKGFPISYMTDNPIWHYRSPNKKEYEKAKIELENFKEKL
jgi:transketolase